MNLTSEWTLLLIRDFAEMTRFVLLGFAMAVMTLKLPPIKQVSSSDSFLDMSFYFVILWKNNSEVNASLLKTSKVRHSNLNSITKIHAQLIHILQQLQSIIICALRDLHTPCILSKSLLSPVIQFSANLLQLQSQRTGNAAWNARGKGRT